MSEIFISHAERDGQVARDLGVELEKAGFKVWFYERDSLPGATYLSQVAHALRECRAVVVVASPEAVKSNQVTNEIVRAYEGGKSLIPVLYNMTHEEFRDSRDDWRQCFGAATSVAIPKEGVATIVHRLAQGLELLGIKPGGPPEPEEGKLGTTPEPVTAPTRQEVEGKTTTTAAQVRPRRSEDTAAASRLTEGDSGAERTTHPVDDVAIRPAKERPRWRPRRWSLGVAATIGLAVVILLIVWLVGVPRRAKPPSTPYLPESTAAKPAEPSAPTTPKADSVVAEKKSTPIVSKPSPPTAALAPASAMELLGPNAQGYQEYFRLRDSAVMVKIPAGEFTMGSDGYTDEEKPAHRVYLDEYYIDKLEVTNRQYKRFCDLTGKGYPTSSDFRNNPDGPVARISWHDARGYCEWVGRRLPTEAEWEKAARGRDARTYPWGGRTPDGSQCNSKIEGDGYITPAPVGHFPSGVSPYGCLDMAGNVAEWCSDWLAAGYYRRSPGSNPKGDSASDKTPPCRVVRGGDYWSSADHVRCAYRDGWKPTGSSNQIGFRCAGSR